MKRWHDCRTAPMRSMCRSRRKDSKPPSTRSRNRCFRACWNVLIPKPQRRRSEEHTSELQSLMRISYAVFCLKKKTQKHKINIHTTKTIKYSPTHRQIHYSSLRPTASHHHNKTR